jgi:hypothetical protein
MLGDEMSVEPKIKTNEHIERLRQCYEDSKMSTVDIELKSVEIFGTYVSRGTIYREIVRHKIGLRNKSESISRSKSSLNIDQSYLNEELIEWIDGLLLGDGYIGFDHSDFSSSRFRIGTSEEQWALYAMSKLSIYNPSNPKVRGKICERRPNPIWMSETKMHPDITIQAKRWYSGINCIKKIPIDIRITPTSVMLWYLGDGSFTYDCKDNSSHLRLATCAFDKYDVKNILIPSLLKHNIECLNDVYKNDIYIHADSIKDFFNYIGWKSPIACYDHKFAVPEWLKLIRLSEIVKTDQEKWRAQYYYKVEKIECSKSPGGKMLLFTREQADKLRRILS